MYDRSRSRVVRRLLGSKLRPIIAGSAAVTAGNQYLADYAGRWNGRVMVVPTVVDTDALQPAPPREPKAPVIGWMGSPSTWPYVRPILPLLRELVGARRAKVLVVGAGHAAKGDIGGGIEYRDWAEEREFADLQEMDIGIMPVPDLPWERGKSGYKLVQYMAVGIPSIASPVGVNSAMLDGGTAGILASSEE
jgi:glycosyltransferase involved in cell wall biosynthesis